jgi:membrane-associated phospholipid phosphatase
MRFDLEAVGRRLSPWGMVLAGYVPLVALGLLGAKLINDPLDRALLLALQPDRYVPLLDEFIVLVTDYSVYTFSITILAWQITRLICWGRETRLRRAFYVWRALAVVLGLFHAAGLFFYEHGIFWWQQHEYRLVLPGLGLAFFTAFWMGAATLRDWDRSTQRRWSRVFWLTLLTVALSNGYGENYIKKTIGRPRPLAGANAPWNEQVRLINDEVVRGGASYISGHASSLFALLTPAMWAARRRKVKAGLAGWAAVHAYTRVYTAAHFPYCALMGSLFGFAVGTLVYFSFRRWVGPQPDGAPGNPAASRA